VDAKFFIRPDVAIDGVTVVAHAAAIDFVGGAQVADVGGVPTVTVGQGLNADVTLGTSTTAAGAGNNVAVAAGDGVTSGIGGTITIQPGAGAAAADGETYLKHADGTTVLTVGNTTQRVELNTEVAFTGVISPTALAAQTDDWNPTSLNLCSRIRLSLTGDQDLTGIAGGFDGRQLVITNLDAVDTVTLINQSASSSAINRISTMDGSDLALAPAESAILHYDASTGGWRVISAPGGGGVAGSTTEIQYNLAGVLTANSTFTIVTGSEYLNTPRIIRAGTHTLNTNPYNAYSTVYDGGGTNGTDWGTPVNSEAWLMRLWGDGTFGTNDDGFGVDNGAFWINSGRGLMRIYSAGTLIQAGNGTSTKILAAIQGLSNANFLIKNFNGTNWATIGVTGVDTFIGLNTVWADDIQLGFGDSKDVSIEWDLGQTNDALVVGVSALGTGAASGAIIVMEKADLGTDLAFASGTDPRLYICSGATPGTNWISFLHDATDAVIETGAGDIVLNPAGNNVRSDSNNTDSLGSFSIAWAFCYANVLQAADNANVQQRDQRQHLRRGRRRHHQRR